MDLEPDRGVFPWLLFGALGLAIGGFMIRGFGQLAVGAATARRLATPVFAAGVVVATIAFLLSVSFKLGILSGDRDSDGESS
jgi:hypothetical protein